MVGFIGALSSSLCILILVFITLLLSYIDSMLPSSSMFKINESTNRFPIKTYFITDQLKDEITDAINIISIDSDKKPNLITVGCTFGFDINNDIANNIMVYNAIKLSSFNINTDIQALQKPIYKDDVLNYCFLDFTRESDNG